MKAVAEKIRAAGSVAILAHDNEDADAYGSSLAMCEAIRRMGKRAVVYLSAEIEERLRFLESDARVFDGNFEKDHDLCLCLDCGDKKRLGERAVIFDAIGNSASIDHHITNDGFADANYVVPSACAAGEILPEVIKELGVEIDKFIAERLYTAIVCDGGCFKFSSVSPKTMRITAELMETGIDHAEICRKLFDEQNIGAVKLKGHIMNNIESTAGGRIRTVTVSDAMYEEYGIESGEIGDIVDIPRSIKGTEIAVCFKVKADCIRVSLRSMGKCDVAQISLKFGGGGHKMAAGASIYAGLDEAKKAVLAECEKAVSEL